MGLFKQVVSKRTVHGGGKDTAESIVVERVVVETPSILVDSEQRTKSRYHLGGLPPESYFC